VEIVPKAERSEVLGDLPQKAFAGYILGPKEPQNLVLGFLGPKMCAAKAILGRNHPKGRAERGFGWFWSQNGVKPKRRPFKEGGYTGFAQNPTWPPLVFL